MITTNKAISSINYYNEIAASYNSRQTASDRVARERISKLFSQYVFSGNVLDFGGGTGLDLSWLAHAGYHIFFLEPSANMRLFAKQMKLSPENNNRINFIETNTDFYQWTPNTLPFYEKMDGILINFAVLNSISNLPLFFRKIRMVCKEGCYLIISLIDARPGITLKKHGISRFARQIICGKSYFYVHFNGLTHKTFIYPVQYLRNCSSRYFNYVFSQFDDLSDFTTVIFSAK
ncbi:MAG: class I SAM-dependent methyltransferase [Chitinophagaceae bacterium]